MPAHPCTSVQLYAYTVPGAQKECAHPGALAIGAKGTAYQSPGFDRKKRLTGESEGMIDGHAPMGRTIKRKAGMTEKTYNGWTNYATWRVNLELIDGIDPWEDLNLGADSYALGQALKAHCEEIVSDGAEGLALDYALAFLSDVNFREIADHMMESFGRGAA